MEAIERSKRSSDLILIRLLLLLFFLFFAQSKHHLKNSMPSSSSRMILSSSMSQSMEVDSNEPSSSQFDADEHEAPNGPNPISNRSGRNYFVRISNVVRRPTRMSHVGTAARYCSVSLTWLILIGL